jgi:hypothetical protein
MRLVELKEIWFRGNNIGVRAVFAKEDGFMDSVFFGDGSTICFRDGYVTLPNEQRISLISLDSILEGSIDRLRKWIKSQSYSRKEKLPWITFMEEESGQFINISTDDLTAGTSLEVNQKAVEKDIMVATKKFLGK